MIILLETILGRFNVNKSRKSYMNYNNENLFKRWDKLFPQAHRKSVKALFETIECAYSQNGRHYHTLSHINECLKHLDSVDIFEKRNVEIALWFHDVVYIPLQNENEQASAFFAESKLFELGECENDINRIKELIMVTKHPSEPKNISEKILVDIDLSILGEHPVVYAKYEENIRKEFRMVAERKYYEGRLNVLNSILQKRRIYTTDYFHDNYENQARTNMTNAIIHIKKHLH